MLTTILLEIISKILKLRNYLVEFYSLNVKLYLQHANKTECLAAFFCVHNGQIGLDCRKASGQVTGLCCFYNVVWSGVKQEGMSVCIEETILFIIFQNTGSMKNSVNLAPSELGICYKYTLNEKATGSSDKKRRMTKASDEPSAIKAPLFVHKNNSISCSRASRSLLYHSKLSQITKHLYHPLNFYMMP